LLAFSHGAVIGWASPFVPLLQSELSPIGPITTEEVSWVGACLAIGGLIGTLVFAVVSKYVGKKFGIMLLAVPHIVCWLLILFGHSVYYLYAARILGGCAGGGIIRQFSLYISDISENQ
jgi:MFS family permease